MLNTSSAHRQAKEKQLLEKGLYKGAWGTAED